MERLRTEQPKGLSREGLRKWGMLFLMLGVFGRSILQARFLGTSDMNNAQLLESLSQVPEAMLVATFAIVFQFVESCAAPIFSLLLAEGYANTSDPVKYIGRVLGVAVISEIPYNYAMGAKFIDMGSRNPVFGLVICLVLLYLYSYFKEKKLTNILMKVLVTVAAIVWCSMLRIDDGICCVLMTIAFWGFRKKPMIRNLMAGGAAMVCCLFSLYYLAAPLAMLVVHFYNGEKGEGNRLVNYLFYPVLLILLSVAGVIAFGF